MRPVIALVGRPNVGKSTLFNRLTRSRDALVANVPGLTRDRQYGDGLVGGRAYIVVDTGGLAENETDIDQAMESQSYLAIDEADIVLFMVDARAGLTPADSQILDQLRKRQKTVFLVVNKIDGSNPEQAMADFHATGLKHLYPITATQGKGVSRLMTEVLATVPEAENDGTTGAQAVGIKIAVVGCPNVGKSTLVNRLLGEERVVVFDLPGTTRDSLYIPYDRRGESYTLIDTAGIRKRGKTRETVEKFSVIKSLQAIDDAHVVIMILDARKGLVEQDLHLLDYIIDAGRALVVAVNKWDGLSQEKKDKLKSDIERRMGFVTFAKKHYISALHGTGVGDLYKSIHAAYDAAQRKLDTNKLTKILERAVEEHAPPMVNGRRIKLRYAHSGGHNPPIIVIHGKQTDKLPAHYTRYLEKTYRKIMKLEGTPIRIHFKSDANPFTSSEKSLNPQKVAQKRRIRKNRQSKQVKK